MVYDTHYVFAIFVMYIYIHIYIYIYIYIYILEFSCRYPSTDDRLVAWIVQFKLAFCFLALFTMSAFGSKCQAKVGSGIAVSGPLGRQVRSGMAVSRDLGRLVGPGMALWNETSLSALSSIRRPPRKHLYRYIYIY